MKYEQYMKMIESTYEDHKKGNLNEIEYISAYNEILDVVVDSKSLTEDEKSSLIKEVRVKIGQMPLVEAERKAAIELKQQQVTKAFQEAKNRFRRLSVFQRIKLNLKGQNPGQLQMESLEIEEINNLYRK